MGHQLLITGIVIAILGVFGVIGYVLIVYVNSKKPEAERKWTDPKNRDHIGKH